MTDFVKKIFQIDNFIINWDILQRIKNVTVNYINVIK